MSRRDHGRTDESAYSISGSIKDLALTGFKLAKDQIFAPEEVAAAKPEQILFRMLSTKSYISTASTLAEVMTAGQGDIVQQQFLEIGKGQCGTVYSLLGTQVVAKLPNAPEKLDQLLSDFKVHISIVQAMRAVDAALQTGIKVPDIKKWVTPNSEFFWRENGLRFPQTVDAQNFALVSERVFPIPFPVREAIVDALLPTAIQRQKEKFLAKPENKNCLIRVYLGKRDTAKTKTNLSNIRLQNFPLHVSEMEDLGLDTSSYARIMAQTLAILHWKAGCDGNDIEFVLGSLPEMRQEPDAREIEDVDKWSMGAYYPDFGHRAIGMWLIDFNQCAKFSDDDAGLKKIVDAFIWNDPYYPRPNTANEKDKQLWSVFCKRYLDVSRALTDSAMPQRFIARIEEQTKKGTVAGLF